MSNEIEILNAIRGSLKQHGYLPKEFDESTRYAQKILKSNKK